MNFDMENSRIDPDGRTVVVRIPRFKAMRSSDDNFRGYQNHKRFWARWLQKLAMKVMKRWGQSYPVTTTVKYYAPMEDGTPIVKSMMRQIDVYIEHMDLDLDKLAFFVGCNEWDELTHHSMTTMPDLAYGWKGRHGTPMRRHWRGMPAIVLPDIVGAIVVPKSALRDALNTHPKESY